MDDGDLHADLQAKILSTDGTPCGATVFAPFHAAYHIGQMGWGKAYPRANTSVLLRPPAATCPCTHNSDVLHWPSSSGGAVGVYSWRTRSITDHASNGTMISWCPVISYPAPPSSVGRCTTFTRGR